MLRRVLVLATIAAPFVAPLPAGAGPECRCRSAGQMFEHGQLACIKTNAGVKLARCDMAQNVASWTIVGDACPQANATPLPRPAAAIAAAFAVRRPG
jgi:hypothetical protein